MTDDVALSDLPGQNGPTLGPEIDLFTKHVDAIGDVLVFTVWIIHVLTQNSKVQISEFEAGNCELKEGAEERTVVIPNTHIREWKRLQREYEHFALSSSLLPRSLLVSLVSQYDAYLGRLLRTIFLRRPEIMNSPDKKISYETLGQFKSLDALKEHILEKEIEAILRTSHPDQFTWMENSFGLTLKKGLAIWPSFVEIIERRNLFVHTDGVVSSQYITVCKQHSFKLEESVREGVPLDVTKALF